MGQSTLQPGPVTAQPSRVPEMGSNLVKTESIDSDPVDEGDKITLCCASWVTCCSATAALS